MPSLIPERLDVPGTHVLVVGVSAYRHFDDGEEPTHNGTLLGMEQLSAAARSASEFAAWMLEEYSNPRVPLSSLRVLLSPSPGEIVHPAIGTLKPEVATLANVERELVEFRTACGTDTENVAVVYVAGHGVQLTKTGAVVLLHDCGAQGHATLLRGAIDMAGVHAGFDHSETAQTQFWFVDACRQKPSVARHFEILDGGLTLDAPMGSAQTTPMLLAATSGTQAYARVGGLSLFAEALLTGLRGSIARPPDPSVSNRWHVSSLELVRRLQGTVRALAAVEGAEQRVDPAGRVSEALFHEFDVPPHVEVIVELAPAQARQGSVGSLRHVQRGAVLDNVTTWPMRGEVEAGIYTLLVQACPGFRDHADYISVVPPPTPATVELTP